MKVQGSNVLLVLVILFCQAGLNSFTLALFQKKNCYYGSEENEYYFRNNSNNSEDSSDDNNKNNIKK